MRPWASHLDGETTGADGLQLCDAQLRACEVFHHHGNRLEHPLGARAGHSKVIQNRVIASGRELLRKFNQRSHVPRAELCRVILGSTSSQRDPFFTQVRLIDKTAAAASLHRIHAGGDPRGGRFRVAEVVQVVVTWASDVAAGCILFSPGWIRHHLTVQLEVERPVNDAVEIKERRGASAFLGDLTACGWSGQLLALSGTVRQKHREALFIRGHRELGDRLHGGRRPGPRGVCAVEEHGQRTP